MNTIHLEPTVGKPTAHQGFEEQDLDALDDAAFSGKSVRIVDPMTYSRIHSDDLGHIIRAADFKGRKKPSYQDRLFQLNVDHFPGGAVLLPGRAFKITEMGAAGEELVGSYIRLLRRPVRKELRDRELQRKDLGQVEAYKGQEKFDGLDEDLYDVQMLTEPHLKAVGKLVVLHRHEFEVVPKPNVPEAIQAPANLFPPGTEVRVHNPLPKPGQDDPHSWVMMLQDQHGVVKGWNKANGRYVVLLTVYQKEVELLPIEIEIWKDIPKLAPVPIVVHEGPELRKDCNYTSLAKWEQKADGHLSAIHKQIQEDLMPKVETATKKHNDYVKNLWVNTIGLDDLNDSMDKFRESVAGTDEGTDAELEAVIDKGMKEVHMNTQMANEFREFNARRMEGVKASHELGAKDLREELQSESALGITKDNPHFAHFEPLRRLLHEQEGAEKRAEMDELRSAESTSAGDARSDESSEGEVTSGDERGRAFVHSIGGGSSNELRP